MKHKWPFTPLGEVLAERRELPSEQDLASGRVRIIEKISFDTGQIKLRVDSSTKTGMILVRPGDLVLSGINAAKGAIAIYDPKATEPVAATIHYGAYVPDSGRADVAFLWWMLRSRVFQELLLEYVPGGIKTELKAKRLLPVPVPLPPLEEQRRLTARIEELAARIGEVHTLRNQAVEETEALVEAAKDGVLERPALQRWRVKLKDADLVINRESRNPAREFPDEIFTYVDISSVGRGPSLLTVGRQMQGGEAPTRARRVIHENDIILSTVRPNLRAFAKIGRELDNQICSTGFAVVSCGPSLDPDFMLLQFCSSFFVRQCMDRTTGAHYPAIKDSNLRETEIIVPPKSEQRQIVAELDALQTELDALKRLQADTATKIDALLPAILDRAFKGEL